MAAATSKLLLDMLFFCVLTAQGRGSGDGYCPASSIQLQQTNTGLKVGYDPVFEVEVKNLCRRCTITGVFLRSEGFASSMVVDPKLFRREGDDYLLNDGRAIPSSRSVKFRYSWDRAFKMTPKSWKVSGC